MAQRFVPQQGDGRRGVSTVGFLVTLAVLLLFLLVVLEFVNRWTRIAAPPAPGPAVRISLDLAVRTLSRDLGRAASGPFPAILDDPVVGEAARTVHAEGQAMLKQIIAGRWLAANGAVAL